MQTTQMLLNMTELRPEHSIFKEQRSKLGYTQDEIAKLCGITTRQYQRYESGERSILSASFRIGVRICSYLKIDIHHFFMSSELPE